MPLNSDLIDSNGLLRILMDTVQSVEGLNHQIYNWLNDSSYLYERFLNFMLS